MNVRLEAINDRLMTLTLQGEFDLGGLKELESKLDAIWLARPDGVIIDLRAVEFIDTTGLRLILMAHRTAKDLGVRLEVVVGAGPVDRVLQLTGLASILPIVPEPPAIQQGERS